MPTNPDLVLEKMEFFRAFGRDRLAYVKPLLSERAFERGTVLFSEGQPAAHLWAVRRGRLRLCKFLSDGRVMALETLKPGQIFGAMSSLDRGRYTATAEGVTDGSAVCLGRATFIRLLSEDPGLANEVLSIVSARLDQAHERLSSVAHEVAPVRLARELLRLALDGEVRTTRRALAEAVGTTVETAIRVLRTLERSGLIEGRFGRVRILDASGLRQIVHDDQD